MPEPFEKMVSALAGPRLPFLTARGLGDLILDRAEERTLTAALGRRTDLQPVHALCNASLGVSVEQRMVRPTLDTLNVDLGRLAATFHSSVRGLDWPDPPVPTATVELAGVVVVFELDVIAYRGLRHGREDLRAIESSSVAVVFGAAALTAFMSQVVLKRLADGCASRLVATAR